MSEQKLVSHGYVCAPYTHDHNSIELKDQWANSKNVEKMYFVTATFSENSKPFFASHANNYILAKFNNNTKIFDDVKKFNQEKTSFVFSLDEDLFERDTEATTNFVSIYYLEYGESEDDITEVANVIAKREKVGKAGVGHMDLFFKTPPKFPFPYGEKIVVLEVSSEKSHQSDNQYCEKTRRDVCRKGITMTNLFGLSILEKLK